MSAGICIVPVSPLRREPSHRSELVTQQLFGETCTVLETAADHWIKVKCSYDGYEGWCQDMHIAVIPEANVNERPQRFAADAINFGTLNNEPIHLPLGSTLDVKGGYQYPFTFTYEGNAWEAAQAKLDAVTIHKLAFKFINTGYLWGGKSNFGIDCSGYTQTVFKMLNISLLRDASQQATQGNQVDDLAETRCGDLAFFDNPEGKITHVGILLNNDQIIHSSGKVRVDLIDREGIINRETSERTHRLRIIKRYF